MSGFYRWGAPGEDTLAHINTGRRSSGEKCRCPRFEKDNPKLGEICGRMSVALCDFPGCDKPMCKLHRTPHPIKSNTDFCDEHVYLAKADDRSDPVKACSSFVAPAAVAGGEISYTRRCQNCGAPELAHSR